MKTAIILAAGEGERLQSIDPFKPMIKVGKKVLLENTLYQLSLLGLERYHIIFNEKEKQMPWHLAPSTRNPNVQYFFKSTLSSLHSLYEITKQINLDEENHYLISMIDSIIRPSDLLNFARYCQSLDNSQSAILTTRFVEDENPLTVKIGLENEVTALQVPLEKESVITSGVYYLNREVLKELQPCVDQGMRKMRNFLKHLVNRGFVLKAFTVDKTLDIDRPEDIKSAEIFLGITDA